MFREQQVSLGATSIQVAMGPENGPVVVLFHGVCRRWQDFGPLLPTLNSRWQVFAVDHRGHGRSSRADRYLLTDYIADATAFISGLERPAILIGHSLGALTVLGVAAAIPHAVRGVVLEDPPSAAFIARLDEPPYATQFRAYRDLTRSTRPTSEVACALATVVLPDGSRLGERRDAASLRFLASCLGDLDSRVLTPILEKRWLDDFDAIFTAAKVVCPVLLLVADVKQGGMLPVADANDLAAAFPDVFRVDCPGVAHSIHGTRPDLFLQAVVNFLDSF
jgi:pimeloyl-ACP methyl ester carboxylesterase